MTIAVFYYTQSGQALSIARSITRPLEQEKENSVVYKEIKPLHKFPFPWSIREFFDAFPESRLGIPPCGIERVDTTDITEARLVIIVGQSWFLSPSLPLQAFLADKVIEEYLHGRRVVFVNCCRNMWLMTMQKVRDSLERIGATMVGHIVLQDDTTNLVSVATIVRWLLYGKKERSWLLPDAGVSVQDIAEASRFGDIIKEHLIADDYGQLQTRLVDAGAIKYKPSVLFLERLGYRMFGLWARFIRCKGGFGNQGRRFRCTIFMVYLIAVLYLVSPLGTLVFWATSPFRRISRYKYDDCYEFSAERKLRT